MQIACKRRQSSHANEIEYSPDQIHLKYHRFQLNEFILDILDLAAAEMLLATSRAVAWNDTRETLGATPG
jgi:uncharacterized protein YqiB (DUF1249 family)